MKKAIVTFMQMIVTAKYPIPNSTFAIETAAELQQKLSYMISNYGEPMALDPNEIIILYTSVWMVAEAGVEKEKDMMLQHLKGKLTSSFHISIKKPRCNSQKKAHR